MCQDSFVNSIWLVWTFIQLYSVAGKSCVVCRQHGLLSHTLHLVLNCLTFDFIGTSTDESSDDLCTVQIPTGWRTGCHSPSVLKPFNAHCCHSGTAVKHRVPDWVKPSCVIFDIVHSDAQGWASECPDVKNYKWRLNPVWHMVPHSCTPYGITGHQTVKLSHMPFLVRGLGCAGMFLWHLLCHWWMNCEWKFDPCFRDPTLYDRTKFIMRWKLIGAQLSLVTYMYYYHLMKT